MTGPDDSRHAGEHRAFDALLPPEIAERAEAAGVKKCGLDFWTLLTLSLLGGAFIGFGAMFATTVGTEVGTALPFGVARLLMGLVFSLGLILIVVGGAELFTGNALIVVAWAARRVGTRSLLRNWTIVYLGNLVGAGATAALVFAGGQHGLGGNAVGAMTLAIAEKKSALGFGEALALGIVANVLVCLAVWLSVGARTTGGKIAAIVFPVAAFVAGGFEHSIANMYFIASGLMIKYLAPEAFWAALGASAADYAHLTGLGFVRNLIPVTIGNMLGGGVLVAAVYWFIYLRRR